LKNVIRIPISRIFGLKWLIIGDVGTGKTALTADILRRMVRRGYAEKITVIDMAPAKIGPIGGPISQYTRAVKKVRYLRPSNVYAPRLMGKEGEDVLKLAELNMRNIEPLIDAYIASPSPILIINDVTIYLHKGSLERLLLCIDKAETAVVNAYYGDSLSDDKGSGLTNREREVVKALMTIFPITINLNSLAISS